MCLYVLQPFISDEQTVTCTADDGATREAAERRRDPGMDMRPGRMDLARPAGLATGCEVVSLEGAKPRLALAFDVQTISTRIVQAV